MAKYQAVLGILPIYWAHSAMPLQAATWTAGNDGLTSMTGQVLALKQYPQQQQPKRHYLPAIAALLAWVTSH